MEESSTLKKKRRNLTRKKITLKAIKLADKKGLESLSMRSLAKTLGVEAMSLYNHVKNKSDLIDAIVDQIFSEVSWPYQSSDWKKAMIQRSVSIRQVIKKHPWSISILESRKNPGHHTLLHHNNVIACLLSSGFSLKLAGHAFSALDAYTYGYVMTEQNLPFDDDDQLKDLASDLADNFPKEAYPALYNFTTNFLLKGDYSYSAEFMYGLSMILDQLETKLKG